MRQPVIGERVREKMKDTIREERLRQPKRERKEKVKK